MTKRLTTEEWIAKAQGVHGDRYDYTQVSYVNNSTRVTIICPDHGPFAQIPNSHTNGRGCPSCGNANNIPKNGITAKLTTSDFIKQSQKTHGVRYDYSQTVYINNSTPVTIICPEHGPFEQIPKVHKKGHGCRKCSDVQQAERQKNSMDKNIEKCRSVHGDRYVYDMTGNETSHTKFKTTCTGCDTTFEVNMVNHVGNQSGCPVCSHKISGGELAISEYINSLGFTVTNSRRDIIPPKELDIVVDDKRLAIEYCGIYYHSQGKGNKRPGYHSEKYKKVREAGYRLLTIYSNEWLNKTELVKSRIRYALGIHDKGKPARKLQVYELVYDVARDFFDRYHVQGSVTQMPVIYGAYDGDTLVAVMAFCKPRVFMGRTNGYPELVRFATDGKSYAGVASKLLKRFIRDHQPNGIISYSDRRWSDGDLYQKIGFVHSHSSKPNYQYTSNYRNLEHRFLYQKKRLVKDGYDPEKTEWEIMQERGYDRIWDCGSDVWIMDLDNA